MSDQPCTGLRDSVLPTRPRSERPCASLDQALSEERQGPLRLPSSSVKPRALAAVFPVQTRGLNHHSPVGVRLLSKLHFVVPVGSQSEHDQQTLAIRLSSTPLAAVLRKQLGDMLASSTC